MGYCYGQAMLLYRKTTILKQDWLKILYTKNLWKGDTFDGCQYLVLYILEYIHFEIKLIIYKCMIHHLVKPLSKSKWVYTVFRKMFVNNKILLYNDNLFTNYRLSFHTYVIWKSFSQFYWVSFHMWAIKIFFLFVLSCSHIFNNPSSHRFSGHEGDVKTNFADNV